MIKLKRSTFALFGLALATAVCYARAAEDKPVPLPRSTPEAQGIESADIRAFVEALDQRVHSIHSFMIVRHGKVVSEGWWKPNSAEIPHIMNSLSKSFNSTAVGFAISEGKLSLDDQVIKFFPEDVPPDPSANLKSMRVRDLLRMSAGHETEPQFSQAGAIPWTKWFLAHPVPHKPGAHFMYNTPAAYMLSAIVQKVTGQTVRDYLVTRLFSPLGISVPRWDTSPQGINLGGYGLYVKTEDIAKFGLLYLNKGRFNSVQVVPEAWATAATTLQTATGSNPDSDWDQGYCYQFWRCRHGAFRGDGAGGQFCVVLPDLDTVVALTADTGDMQGELNVVWDKLLPALKPGRVPVSKVETRRLKETIASLSVAKP